MSGVTDEPRDVSDRQALPDSRAQDAATGTASTAPNQHVRWPADRFYWAVLDAGVLPKGTKPSAEQLAYLLEPEVPEPLEAVHAAFAPIGDGRYVACAAPRDALAAEQARGTLTLAPAAVPEFVEKLAVGSDGAMDADTAREPLHVILARLNLLTGPFEPPVVRRARRTSLSVCSLGAMLLVAAAALGIERRVAAAARDADALRAGRDARIEAAIGPAAPGNPLPAPLRLEAELRLLRQTRTQAERVTETRDATDTLVSLLARWPKDGVAQTDSLVVTDQAVHLRGGVGTSDEAQALATALAPLPGLRMEFPSVQAGPDGFRFALEWRRQVAGREAR